MLLSPRVAAFATILFLLPQPSIAADAPPVAIVVKGAIDWKIDSDRGMYKVTTPEGVSYVAGNTLFDAARKPVMSIITTPAGADINDVKDVKIYTLQNESGGYRIYTPDGKMPARIKVGSTLFNLYDASVSTVVAHGKPNADGYAVQDVSCKALLKITGVASLHEASFFALPLPPRVIALLWSALR